MPSEDLLIQLLVTGFIGGAKLAVNQKQTNSQNQKLRRDFLVTKLVQSVICFEQGLEIFTEHLINLNDSALLDCGKRKWQSLIKNAIKASSTASFTRIPEICFALRQVVPYLCLIRDKLDPANPDVVRAKEAFQCSSLIASAIFQSTDITNKNHVIFNIFATTMRINAAIMQYLTSPELLATVVIGHLEQLQQFTLAGWNRKFETQLTRANYLSDLFALLSDLAEFMNLKPEHREEFLKDLRNSTTVGLLSFASKYSVISQTSSSQQGVNDDDLDGPRSVVVNSQGLVIIADSKNENIKAKADDGTFLWQCETQPLSERGTPVALATNQNDEIFAIFCKESTGVHTYVKFDPNGKYLGIFDTRQCFDDVNRDVDPCGMAVSSRGLIYVGDTNNGCIHVLKNRNGMILLKRNLIFKKAFLPHFSFCLGPNDKIVVATSKIIFIFHENGSLQKDMALQQRNAPKVKRWKPLAVAYDKNNEDVIIITAGEMTEVTKCWSSGTTYVKPKMWFLSESCDLVLATEFTLDDIDSNNGRFAIAVGKSGLWCVSEATHRLHCFKMLRHLIKT